MLQLHLPCGVPSRHAWYSESQELSCLTLDLLYSTQGPLELSSLIDIHVTSYSPLNHPPQLLSPCMGTALIGSSPESYQSWGVGVAPIVTDSVESLGSTDLFNHLLWSLIVPDIPFICCFRAGAVFSCLAVVCHPTVHLREAWSLVW
jgi:hypothetical protein